MLIACALLLLNSACASKKMAKQLLYHNTQLTQLADKQMDPSEKVDIMAALMVEALEESLTFSKTKDSVKFLKTYTKQNKPAIDILYGEISQWYNGLSMSSKLIETTRIATKPYVRQLLNVAPKVEKKIERKLDTIFFLSRFTKLLKLA